MNMRYSFDKSCKIVFALCIHFGVLTNYNSSTGQFDVRHPISTSPPSEIYIYIKNTHKIVLHFFVSVIKNSSKVQIDFRVDPSAVHWIWWQLN